MFHGALEKCFIVPADTFDNVKGKFPIGFFVWRMGDGVFTSVVADVYDRKGEFVGTKTLYAVSRDRVINTWLHGFFDPSGETIGWLCFVPNDFQHNNGVFIASKPSESLIRESRVAAITKRNAKVMAIYMAVRHCIDATWLNDRDQFLYPNDGWKDDAAFQADCLVYALFSGQNRVKSADGVNHWIPFTEEEVGAKDCFASHFMSDFINGRGERPRSPADARDARPYQSDLFAETPHSNPGNPVNPVKNNSADSVPPRLCVRESLSPAARAVLDAGRELWRYYHAQPDANPNASYYDIRAYFQGCKPNGAMNAKSDDATYNALLAALRTAHKALAAQIEPKVYDYGFLKR